MARQMLPLLAAVIGSMTFPTVASAQVSANPSAQERSLRIGLVLGTGALPATIDGGCNDREGWDLEALASVRMILSLGRLGLEATVGRQQPGLTACLDDTAAPSDGIGTSALPAVDHATAFYVTDLRLRYAIDQNDRIMLAFGPGWAWTKDLPYWSAGADYRWGERLRWLVGVEATAYRVPFWRQTAAYEQGRLVRVISQERYHDWDMGFGLRVGAELPIGL